METRSRQGRALVYAGLVLAVLLVLFQLEAAIRLVSNRALGFDEVTSQLGRLVLLASQGPPGDGTVLALRLTVAVTGAFGIASAALAAWILWITDMGRPANRLIAQLLLATSALVATLYFLDGLARFADVAASAHPLISAVEFALTVFVMLGIARFLCVFPRPVEGDLVCETYFSRGLGRWLGGRAERARLLLAWHRSLVSGSIVLAGTLLAAFAPLLAGFAEARWPWDGWGGVWAVAILVGGLFYFLFGIPYAFASTTHLKRYGDDAERGRVARLRAITWGLLVLYLIVAAALFVLSLVARTQERAVMVAIDIVLLTMIGMWTLLPQILVVGLAMAVLPGGQLDPRLAFTRITAWSLLGVVLSLAFLMVERFFALRLVGWFGLSPNSGAVAAGALVAASFVPLRRVLTARMDRLAERLIPLEVLAAGKQVERAVLITDLSGYTALSAVDEAAARLQSAALARLGENAAERVGGRLVKSLGDAVMVVLPDAAAALRAAREIHAQFPQAASTLGLAPLALHSAIHAGTLVEARDGDIFGQTVNVTARLVNAAKGGEIVLSDAALKQVPDAAGFESMGAQRFKNVPEPVLCHRLGVGG